MAPTADTSTADKYDQLRGPIEATHNAQREAITKQFIQDKLDLEDQYHTDIAANATAKQTALVAAGLNPDGSDPLGRQQGSVE